MNKNYKTLNAQSNYHPNIKPKTSNRLFKKRAKVNIFSSSIDSSKSKSKNTGQNNCYSKNIGIIETKNSKSNNMKNSYFYPNKLKLKNYMNVHYNK